MEKMVIKNKFDLVRAIVRAKLLRKSSPIFIQFSITNKCNIKCVYCGYHSRIQNELSTDEVFLIIDELAKLGTKRICLSGGEPLLRKDIGEVIDHIKGYNIQCTIISNGILVPAKLDIIHKLDLIILSIDGDKEAHDRNRGIGSFEKVIQAAHIITNLKIPLQISTALTKNNMDSLEFIFKIAKKLGCKASIHPLYHSPKDSQGPFFYMSTNEEYRKAIRNILKAKKKGSPAVFSTKTYKYILDWPDYRKDMIIGEKLKRDSPKCYAGRLFGYIDTNGDFYPCVLFNGAIKARNCIKDGVRKAWNFCSNHNCTACCYACLLEYNYALSLNWSVIKDLILNR